MDSPPKYRLKNIVFVKHMDDTLWAARIIKVIKELNLYQVSYFNQPFIAYIEETNLIPFTPDFAK